MVPGDIYIGKSTLIQYEIRPAFAGDYDGPDDIVVEHLKCGETEVIRFDDYYKRSYLGSSVPLEDPFVRKNPWDILDAILKHEKECPAKCKKDALPADDSSTTSAKLQVSQDAVALAEEIKTYKFNPHSSPSRANGNVYASEAEMRNIPMETVNPNPNVL